MRSHRVFSRRISPSGVSCAVLVAHPLAPNGSVTCPDGKTFGYARMYSLGTSVDSLYRVHKDGSTSVQATNLSSNLSCRRGRPEAVRGRPLAGMASQKKPITGIVTSVSVTFSPYTKLASAVNRTGRVNSTKPMGDGISSAEKSYAGKLEWFDAASITSTISSSTKNGVAVARPFASTRIAPFIELSSPGFGTR